MTQETNIKIMTMPEAMKALHLTRPTVMKLITTGELKARKICGRWVFEESNIIAFLRGEPQR